MRWLTWIFPLLVFPQGTFRLGKSFSSQYGLQGVDTVFRIDKAPLTVWVELKARQAWEWDTLWVVLRTVDRLHGVYVLVRTQTDKRLYRGKVLFRQSGIYLLSCMPPRQSRLILGRTRAYLTSSAYPTVAALRAYNRTLAPTSRNAEAALTQIDTASLEMLPLPDDLLTTPEGGTDPALEKELLELDDTDSLLDLPLEVEPEEELDLEELNLDEDL
uniref:Uncharacterized protein n=1 Tax=uncultured Bacteroidota bacterium TaxID=152509 RepID=H5SNU4_9BACT|nr:hypothetical protein HGMM_F52E02C13 [uncultured Bacteroidetes bacterium]